MDNNTLLSQTTSSESVMPYSRVPAGFVSYRPVSEEDIETISEIESNSYPEDEKASLETLRYRCINAGEMFLVATEHGGSENEIIGYVCGTCVNENETLTAETMGSKHEPDGAILCVHSVCVKENKRRRGVGGKLLQTYLMYLKARNNDRKRDNQSELKSVRLLCKKHMIPFYQNCGFTLLGESEVTHGKDAWFDCEFTLLD
jgi:GNAT superfamily N-acetyltransferase